MKQISKADKDKALFTQYMSLIQSKVSKMTYTVSHMSVEIADMRKRTIDPERTSGEVQLIETELLSVHRERMALRSQIIRLYDTIKTYKPLSQAEIKTDDEKGQGVVIPLFLLTWSWLLRYFKIESILGKEDYIRLD